MSNLIHANELLMGFSQSKNSVNQKNEQEAIKLANNFADTIFGVFRDKMNTAGAEVEKDSKTKIPTGVKASIVVENPELLTEGGINSLNNQFISMVTTNGYIVQVTKSIDDILRYKEFAVEIKIPGQNLEASGLKEYIINIGQVNAEKVAKENFLSSTKRQEIDYVKMAEESKETGTEIPLGGIAITDNGNGVENIVSL